MRLVLGLRQCAVVAVMALAIGTLGACTADPCAVEYGDGFMEIPENQWTGEPMYCTDGAIDAVHPDFL